MSYSVAFKAQMIRKMTGPGAVSATALAKESGVSQGTLSRWKREASSVLSVSTKPTEPEKRVQDWTPPEKLGAVMETANLDEAALGRYLREKGLHAETLEQWRTEALEALGGGQSGKRKKGKRSPEQKQLRRLERELRRKDKALAEAAALLVLQKKFNAYLEGEDIDTLLGSDD